MKEIGDRLRLGGGEAADQVQPFGNAFRAGDGYAVDSDPDPQDLAEIVAQIKDAKRQANWVVVSSHSHEGGTIRDLPAPFVEKWAYETPPFQPAENYQRYGLPDEALPGEFYDHREQQVGYFSQNQPCRMSREGLSCQLMWEGAVPIVTFRNGRLECHDATLRSGSDRDAHPRDAAYGRKRWFIGQGGRAATKEGSPLAAARSRR